MYQAGYTLSSFFRIQFIFNSSFGNNLSLSIHLYCYTRHAICIPIAQLNSNDKRFMTKSTPIYLDTFFGVVIMNVWYTEKIKKYEAYLMDINERIVREVRKSFVGNQEIIHKVLITLLAGGHVLLEDIPGVGKTTLAVAFSKALDLSCKRVQFTPDVMPADVTGFSIPRPDTRALEYQPGAVMCNFFLADEINRASTRTQSALLEAMQENAVTVDGVTYELPQPFMVIATQNPAGSSGTQLLPESQTDRFMIRLSIGYPSEGAEMEMLLRKHGRNVASPTRHVTNSDELLAMRQAVSHTHIQKELYEYIIRLSRATRIHPLIAQGASPRCTAALAALSQATAFILGRDYVVPDDVQSIYADCTAHRLVLTPQAKREAVPPIDILADILEKTPFPRLSAKR